LDFYFEGGTKPLQSNTTGLRNLNFDSYLQTEVRCPPIDEQRKIAAVLGKVQAAVAVEGDLVRVARELKQAALRQLFTRGLRHELQKQTTLGLVPESWDVVPVAECVTPFRFDRKQQVPAAAYSETGRFPIVDQGKQAIAGYCDDETKVITPRPALIVFGDHTRCVKFVDFPFVLGSDGTKPLVAKPEWDARTLFYALSSVDVESHGYNRHYKYLSEKLVARSPDPAEQREIAALLATLDAKIAHHEARQAVLRELFRTLLHELLTARRRVTSLDLDHLVDPNKLVPATPPTDFSASNLTRPSRSPALG
jgi:type I restriction enzyme S subunit